MESAFIIAQALRVPQATLVDHGLETVVAVRGGLSTPCLTKAVGIYILHIDAKSRKVARGGCSSWARLSTITRFHAFQVVASCLGERPKVPEQMASTTTGFVSTCRVSYCVPYLNSLDPDNISKTLVAGLPECRAAASLLAAVADSGQIDLQLLLGYFEALSASLPGFSDVEFIRLFYCALDCENTKLRESLIFTPLDNCRKELCTALRWEGNPDVLGAGVSALMNRSVSWVNA